MEPALDVFLYFTDFDKCYKIRELNKNLKSEACLVALHRH